MHSKNIRDMLINMYKELKNYNIIGTERKNFIYKISNIHTNSIYNWIKNINVVEVKRKDYIPIPKIFCTILFNCLIIK
jgi:hypothetical protein